MVLRTTQIWDLQQEVTCRSTEYNKESHFDIHMKQRTNTLQKIGVRNQPVSLSTCFIIWSYLNKRFKHMITIAVLKV